MDSTPSRATPMFADPLSALGLHSNSKKIQKLSHNSPSNNDDLRKYATFSKSVKKNMLKRLWMGVVQILQLDLNEDSFSPQDLLQFIERLSLPQYNYVLTLVLSQYVANFEAKGNILTQWKKKVTRWAEKLDKQETRGGPVVPVERTEDFKQIILQILEHLPYRCIPTLRSRVLAVLRDWHNKSQNPKPFKESTCSKHWWLDYQAKNPDIKEKWDRLPLLRQVNCKNKSKSKINSQVSPSNETTHGSVSLMSGVSSPLEKKQLVFSPSEGEQEGFLLLGSQENINMEEESNRFSLNLNKEALAVDSFFVNWDNFENYNSELLDGDLDYDKWRREEFQ